jgi:hypothetical protein
MNNYELFKALREDFFVELNDADLTDIQKSNIRENFTASFMRTMFHFIEKGINIKEV